MDDPAMSWIPPCAPTRIRSAHGERSTSRSGGSSCVALEFAVAAVYEFWRAVTRRFMKDMKTRPDWVETVGVAGHLARRAVWAIVAWALMKAPWQYDPKEAVGLDGPDARLRSANYAASRNVRRYAQASARSHASTSSGETTSVHRRENLARRVTSIDDSKSPHHCHSPGLSGTRLNSIPRATDDT